MQPPRLILLLTLLLTTAAHAQTRLVFAHYHLPYAPYGHSVEGYKRDIRDAQQAGLDGFALNFGGWGSEGGQYRDKVAMMFRAVTELHTDFKLFLSPDESGHITAEEHREMMRLYANHPNYFHYQGRPVLSSWSGEGDRDGQSAHDWWLHEVLQPLRREGINVYFVPMFYTVIDGHYYETPQYEQVLANYNAWWKDVVDGMFYFGAAGTPVGNDITRTGEAYARVLHEHGRTFMGFANPQYWGAQQGGGRRYFEFAGGEGLAAQWRSTIEVQKPEWIEMFTWNDFTEASYFSPVDEPAFGNWTPRTEWGFGFFHAHRGLLELNKYFIQWYKTGRQPPIIEDRLFYAYRTHPKTAVATYDPRGSVTDLHGDVEDVIYVTTLLRSPAQLRVTTGGVPKTYNVGAGMVHTHVPFNAGAQVFELWRNGKLLTRRAGDTIYAVPSRYNFIYTSGSLSATPQPDLTVQSLTWSPPNPAPGDEVRFTATVLNQGNAALRNASVPVGFTLDGTLALHGTARIATLAPGATATVTADASWPATAGGHNAEVEVDNLRQIEETDEGNNLYRTTIAVGPTIAVTYAAASGSAAPVDLAREGTVDWIRWGATDATSVARKPGVSPQIAKYTVIGPAAPQRAGDGLVSFSTPGGPTTSSAITVIGNGNGFHFTAPAGTTPHTLRLYVGGDHSAAKLMLSLSDHSTGPFSEPMYAANANGPYATVYTVTYRAATPDQTLSVDWQMTGGTGSVSLFAAAVR